MSSSSSIRRRALLLGGLGGLSGVGGLTTGCSLGPERPAADTLTIAGGENGGTFVKTARLLAGVVVENGVSTTAGVASTDGSIQNLSMLRRGLVDMAPVLADAVEPDRDQGLVAIARMYQITLHCIVRASSSIRRLEDLWGRRVAIGPPRSGTAETADRVLRAAGLRPGSDLWTNAAPGDSAISLAGGTIDAMLWWGGRPSSEILSVTSVEPFRVIGIREVLAQANRDAGGDYQLVQLPGAVYRPGEPDVSTLGVAVHLLCRADLDEEIVVRVVDILSKTGTRLVPQPADGIQFFSSSTLFDTHPVQLHPAAVRRFQQLHG